MNIQNYKSDYGDKSITSFRGVPANPKFIPEALGNIGKVVGEYVYAPEQKLFLATSALLLQPLIDLKFADEDKKEDAAIKSASKAFAGGLTGVPIRALFIALCNHFITLDLTKQNFLKRHFYPDGLNEMMKNSNEEPVKKAMAQFKLKNYNRTLGTLFAIIFMIAFSNSKVDVPLTSDIQDILSGIIKEKKNWKKSIYDTAQNRKQKTIDWLLDKKKKADKVLVKIKKIAKIITEDPDKKKEAKKK